MHGAQAIRPKNILDNSTVKVLCIQLVSCLHPRYDLLSVTADGTVYESNITVTTDDVDLGLQVGAGIRLVGIEIRI